MKDGRGRDKAIVRAELEDIVKYMTNLNDVMYNADHMHVNEYT